MSFLKLLQKLLRCGCSKAIADSLSRRNYRMSDVGIPEIWHFIYKSRSTSQLTLPDYGQPYTPADEQARLFAIYQWVHNRMHSQARPLKIVFHVGKYESILGWVSISTCTCLSLIVCLIERLSVWLFAWISMSMCQGDYISTFCRLPISLSKAFVTRSSVLDFGCVMDLDF